MEMEMERGRGRGGGPPSDVHRPTRVRIAEAIADDPHADAIHGALRAAHHPEALAAEFCAMADGMRGPPVPWPVICRAVHEIQVGGGRITAHSLRGFARKLTDQLPGQAPEADGDEWEAALQRMYPDAKEAA